MSCLVHCCIAEESDSFDSCAVEIDSYFGFAYTLDSDTDYPSNLY